MSKLKAVQTIRIKASPAGVWEALTNPELIRKYFFGTEAVSDWRKGSPLVFRGIWEGKPYEDKGIILELEKEKMLTYSYWSSFSGKADLPENYSRVTYTLQEGSGSTELTVVQDGIESEEARQHSENNWSVVLQGLRKLLED